MRTRLATWMVPALLFGAVYFVGTLDRDSGSSVVASALRQEPSPSGPCAGLTLDAPTLAWVFAPAPAPGAPEPSVKLTSDESFQISFGGSSYDVAVTDAGANVSGGDPTSAARLQADVSACIAGVAPEGLPNTFGASGIYGVTVEGGAP